MSTCWVAWAPEEWDSGIRAVAPTRDLLIQALKKRYGKYRVYWSRVENDTIYDYINMLVPNSGQVIVDRIDLLEFEYFEGENYK